MFEQVFAEISEKKTTQAILRRSLWVVHGNSQERCWDGIPKEPVKEMLKELLEKFTIFGENYVGMLTLISSKWSTALHTQSLKKFMQISLMYFILIISRRNFKMNCWKVVWRKFFKDSWNNSWQNAGSVFWAILVKIFPIESFEEFLKKSLQILLGHRWIPWWNSWKL